MKKGDPRPRVVQKAAVAKECAARKTISFYRYVRLADPDALRSRLLARWGGLECFGRVYLAPDGINAQMSVPLATWQQFDAWNKTQPELSGVPYKLALKEGSEPSFYKLTIKVKDKIVADGLTDDTFDPSNTGPYLTAAEFNEYLDDPEAVVIDMRNAYESEVGHFTGALLPQTDTFRAELTAAPSRYRRHQNKKIALYCTGGIRCEKASAWLKHHGYQNVKHLRGGIIDYAHQVARQGLANKFLGKNFVFDERLGERVSNEIIATCHLCRHTKCDSHHHCAFSPCHELFIGCATCLRRYRGYCSRRCWLADQLPARFKKRYANYRRSKRRPFAKARLLKKRA